MPLSEHDEAQKADTKDLAAKIAKDLRDLHQLVVLAQSRSRVDERGGAHHQVDNHLARRPCCPAGIYNQVCGFSRFIAPSRFSMSSISSRAARVRCPRRGAC